MKEIHILLVEDNEGDIILTMEALKEAKVKNKVSIAKDGEEAISILFQTGKYAGAELPDLILMDINLPKIDGKEVLMKIKTHERLKVIPVVMLTTSNAEKDIAESYSNHANCYIVKPVDMDKFLTVIHSIEDFWLTIVKLPGIK
ncbi:MAG: response regulator [Chitinophagaceae bacterium]